MRYALIGVLWMLSYGLYAVEYGQKPPAGIAWGWQNYVLFDFDRADIRADQQAQLKHLAEVLQLSPHVHIFLSGRADTTGDVGYNNKLSKRRVAAVAEFFIQQGIEPERIQAQVFGEQRPIADNATDVDRKRNRRVDMAFFPRGYPPPAVEEIPPDVPTFPAANEQIHL